MLSRFRGSYEQATIPLGKACLKLGLKPDYWTVFSVLTSIVTAAVLAQGRWGWGALLVLVTDLTDMLDGAAARAGGTSTRFGTVLDHVCDRYAEFIIMAGLVVSGRVDPLLVIFAASGMIMASYVRAKAESVGCQPQGAVGLAGRLEKLLILMIGLALQGLGWFDGAITWALAIIGTISHITALQRLAYSRKVMLASSVEQGG